MISQGFSIASKEVVPTSYCTTYKGVTYSEVVLGKKESNYQPKQKLLCHILCHWYPKTYIILGEHIPLKGTKISSEHTLV